jgi:hypothetical protein
MAEQAHGDRNMRSLPQARGGDALSQLRDDGSVEWYRLTTPIVGALDQVAAELLAMPGFPSDGASLRIEGQDDGGFRVVVTIGNRDSIYHLQSITLAELIVSKGVESTTRQLTNLLWSERPA